MGIVLAIIIFSFIVFFHELGHFLLAKKNGIDVNEFAIGMGPVLYSREYKGTKFGEGVSGGRSRDAGRGYHRQDRRQENLSVPGDHCV